MYFLYQPAKGSRQRGPEEPVRIPAALRFACAAPRPTYLSECGSFF